MLTRRIAILALFPLPALAQTPPDYGYQFATVGAVNNPAFQDPTYPYPVHNLGRGSVSYEYRIAKTEVSTGQWVEFLNAFSNYATPHPQWNTRFGANLLGWVRAGHHTRRRHALRHLQCTQRRELSRGRDQLVHGRALLQLAQQRQEQRSQLAHHWRV